jgi:peptide/nickel transport system substrate-binding protein
MICEYIATALKEVGINCRLHGVDLPDLSRSFDEKSFDAVFMGWGLGSPPEDPEALWHSSGATEKGSSNAIGFKNPEIDQIIENLHFEYDKEKRLSLYHRFHTIIHEEIPYTFLYSPKRKLLYREYVKNIFIPKERQDLVPGAEVMEPDLRIVWLDQ